MCRPAASREVGAEGEHEVADYVADWWSLTLC
jgi:hypothetical protein